MIGDGDERARLGEAEGAAEADEVGLVAGAERAAEAARLAAVPAVVLTAAGRAVVA
jgi:hypothetical protein